MTERQGTTSWFTCPGLNARPGLRLFCFPYAGGSPLVFRGWAGGLPKAVEVCPVLLPGRGMRLAEPPFTRMPSLVETVAAALLPYTDRPFAFFGHSMGALISFELARLLRGRHGVEPAHVFVSGCSAPQIPDAIPRLSDLPEPELLQELRRLNGTPKEVFENSELMQLMVPVLRADFSVCESYVYTEARPLDCPISVFGGLQDADTSRAQLEAWRCHTSAHFSLQMFPGDHFFLHASRPLLLRALSLQLHQLINSDGGAASPV
jgi:medium-chain acyl-[acyl-carrier-protein] hydrolase